MKNLLWISLVIWFFTACSPAMVKGYRKGEKVLLSSGIILPMIESSGELQQYNMTIDFRKKYFSGLLLIKETSPERFRCLFSTHFGLSLMDFELTKDSMLIHFCAEPLQNKRLYKLFREDFSTLLGLNSLPAQKAILYTASSTGKNDVYKLTANPGKGYYMPDEKAGYTRQIQTGKGLTKTVFCRTEHPDEPFSIGINHCYIGLKLALYTFF